MGIQGVNFEALFAKHPKHVQPHKNKPREATTNSKRAWPTSAGTDHRRYKHENTVEHENRFPQTQPQTSASTNSPSCASFILQTNASEAQSSPSTTPRTVSRALNSKRQRNAKRRPRRRKLDSILHQECTRNQRRNKTHLRFPQTVRVPPSHTPSAIFLRSFAKILRANTHTNKQQK